MTVDVAEVVERRRLAYLRNSGHEPAKNSRWRRAVTCSCGLKDCPDMRLLLALNGR